MQVAPRTTLKGDARTPAQRAADPHRTGRPPTHGGYGTPTHTSWAAMMSRVKGFSKNQPAYDAVTVCLPWLHYEAFLEDMGPRPPGTSLDRKDGRLGYSPDNCRWADIYTQNQNRRFTSGRRPK